VADGWRHGGVLITGAAIVGSGAVVGVVVGALSEGSAGLWAFIGMGIGAVIAIAVTSIRVFRSL
jgi:hypothetical protein